MVSTNDSYFKEITQRCVLHKLICQNSHLGCSWTEGNQSYLLALLKEVHNQPGTYVVYVCDADDLEFARRDLSLKDATILFNQLIPKTTINELNNLLIQGG